MCQGHVLPFGLTTIYSVVMSIRNPQLQVETAQLASELFLRIGKRFPWLQRERYGQMEVSPYRVAVHLAQTTAVQSYNWIAGRARPNFTEMMHIFRELQDSYDMEIAAKDEELRQLREEVATMRQREVVPGG